jgi:hypothetical protein
VRAAARAVAGEQQRLIEQQQRLAQKAAMLAGDELLQAHIASNGTAARIADYNRQLETLRDQLQSAEQAHERARSERVPLPDELSDTEHARLLAEALADTDERVEAELDGSLADELTPGDLADLYNTTDQTINRWIRDGFPCNKPVYWDADAWLVEGPRKKILRVEAINLELLTEAQRQRLRLLRRQRAATSN